MSSLGLASDLGPEQRLITILSTNDIHGGAEHQYEKDGGAVGGLAYFSGVVRSIRRGLGRQYGSNAGVLVLDGGDQFQGTLISNYSEGMLLYTAMSYVGYDAVVPGNHSYDFGPLGWMEDKVTPESQDQNPRGALERAVGAAKFPLLSANTYMISSLKDQSGRQAKVSNVGCETQAGTQIQWDEAERPWFLAPYVIRDVAGVRVALIGLDNPQTPETTTIENVSDLCFRDEKETYLEVRRALEGKADVFVLVIHDGNTKRDFPVSQLVHELKEARADAVDAVVAGHTHFINNVKVKGVPIVQAFHGGKMFGRIDLVWNTRTKAVERNRTRLFGAISMYHGKCDRFAAETCEESESQDGKVISMEGEAVLYDPRILKLIENARQEVAPIADREIGEARVEVWKSRISESPLGNAMSDAFRRASGSEIAFLNAGGLRTSLPAGKLTYEDLYRVLPFANHGLVIGPMTVDRLLLLLETSIQTCGNRGTLVQSGLKVVYERDCRKADGDQTAKLISVETERGELIYAEGKGIAVPAGRTFLVATLDFLAAGGSGYKGFAGIPLIQDLGIIREVLAEEFFRTPLRLSGKVDGRWKNAVTGGDDTR